MTNITINNKADDMQMHIEKAYEIIDKHLPVNYVQDVLDKFPKDTKITKGIIRNVKNGTNKRLDVLNALVEVALENKQLVENFKTITA